MSISKDPMNDSLEFLSDIQTDRMSSEALIHHKQNQLHFQNTAPETTITNLEAYEAYLKNPSLYQRTYVPIEPDMSVPKKEMYGTVLFLGVLIALFAVLASFMGVGMFVLGGGFFFVIGVTTLGKQSIKYFEEKKSQIEKHHADHQRQQKIIEELLRRGAENRPDHSYSPSKEYDIFLINQQNGKS